jgi:small conductance mechanosensitive channel
MTMSFLVNTTWISFVEWLREFDKTRTFKFAVILLICITILFIVRLSVKAVRRIVNTHHGDITTDAERRAATLGAVINNTAKVLLVVFFLLATIHEFGVSIGPLLAGASIAGVALGFGAQAIVKDVLNGFFLLMENQFGVGDIINIEGSHIGTVERMTLRVTTLRDLEGRAHFIPNGTIERVIVLSKEFARALLDVEIGFEQDVDRISSILEEIGQEMLRDMPDKVLEPLGVMGVEAITHSGYIIRTLTKTARACQWEVTRELRRRILIRFRAEGVKVPVPQRLVWNKTPE